MRFILKYKQGTYQKKTQRIYVKDCTTTDKLIEYVEHKVSKKSYEFILRYKSDKLNFKIIKGWTMDHFQIRQGSELQLQILQQQQKELKIKYQNKYLLNLLGNQKTQLKQINQQNQSEEDEENKKKYFDVRQYLDVECEKLLKLVQKGKLNNILKLLVQLPGDIDQQYIIQIQRAKPKIINELGEGGWGAIHYAIFCNKVDILNQLIKQDVDINKCTNDGWLPLQLAINKKNQAIIEILMSQQKLNINQLTTRGTALHTACKISDLKTMQLLLKKQADWKLVDEKGKNCYQVCQNIQCTNLLKKYQQKLKQKELKARLFIEDLVILKGTILKAKTIFLSLKQRYIVLNPFQGVLIQYQNETNYPKKPNQITPLTEINEIKFLKNQEKTWQMKKQYNYIEINYQKKLIIATKNYKIAQRLYNSLIDAIKFQKYIEANKIILDNDIEQKQIVTFDDKNNKFYSNKDKIKPQLQIVHNNHEVKKKQTILISKNYHKSISDQSSDGMSPRMPYPTQSISSRPSDNTSFGSSQKTQTMQLKSPDQFNQISIDMDSKLTKKQQYQRSNKQLTRELKTITNQKVNFSTFQILQTLGSGAFGKVYLVRHIYTKINYAMKALKKKSLILKKQLKYAITEANILKQANNPFIINLHYAFQTPNFLYLVLDYCPGKDLNFHLTRQLQFSQYDAKFYTAELLLAIEHLHQKNILYRDLKPQNILLDADGHIKLADFGLSKDNVEQSKSFCGTAAYLSPQMLNQKGVGKQSDIYGIGCVLYQFLVGQPPYYSDDILTLYNNIREAKLKFPKNISQQAKNLIIGLLQRDPKKRLGCKSKDQIKSHPFFADINWKDLYEKRIKAPKRDYDPNEEDSDDQILLKNEKIINFKDFDYADSQKKINKLNGFSFVRS